MFHVFLNTYDKNPRELSPKFVIVFLVRANKLHWTVSVTPVASQTAPVVGHQMKFTVRECGSNL